MVARAALLSRGGARPPCRSKEDILSEIRRLQAEMSALEDRVQSSAKLMNGSGGAGGGAGGPGQAQDAAPVTLLPSNAGAASAPQDKAQDDKDK